MERCAKNRKDFKQWNNSYETILISFSICIDIYKRAKFFLKLSAKTFLFTKRSYSFIFSKFLYSDVKTFKKLYSIIFNCTKEIF